LFGKSVVEKISRRVGEFGIYLSIVRSANTHLFLQSQAVIIHYVFGVDAPVNKLNGWEREIIKERDQKIEAARELGKRERLRIPSANPMLYQKDNTVLLNSLLQAARLSIANQGGTFNKKRFKFYRNIAENNSNRF